VVTVVDHAEGVVRSGAEQRDELLVSAQAQKRSRERCSARGSASWEG
jgi:hypothetical protein